MRREWTGWIKNRQWSEFEKAAKTDPCQALADTVAELELGFPDKPDRKALRKVLFLLSQAGYVPTEIEIQTETMAESAAPITTAFLVSAGPAADEVITIAREEHGRVRWLVAHLIHPDGTLRATEYNIAIDEIDDQLRSMENTSPSLAVSAEVPYEFGIARLAKAISLGKKMPPVMAYWRALLPPPMEFHPADALPRNAVTREDPGTLVLGPDPKIAWRLEIGALTPALKEMLALREQGQDMSWGTGTPEWDVSLASSRARLFTDTLTSAHRLMLLDLAYLMHLKRDPVCADVLAAADELRDLGPESTFAKTMTTKTLLLLINTLHDRSATTQSEQSSGNRS